MQYCSTIHAHIFVTTKKLCVLEAAYGNDNADGMRFNAIQTTEHTTSRSETSSQKLAFDLHDVPDAMHFNSFSGLHGIELLLVPCGGSHYGCQKSVDFPFLFFSDVPD